MCNQDRPPTPLYIVRVITSISIEHDQLETLRPSFPIRGIRYAIEFRTPHVAIAPLPRVEAVLFGIGGSFAEENEEQGCQRWEAGADDAEAYFDAGPELGGGAGVWDRFVI